MLERPDIDIVHVATPPHWHALISVAAAEAGKDVWCEKPMTRTIAEGRAVVGAVERNGRVFRVNTWFRFQDRFYGFGTDVKPVKKAVQGGLLGWPIKATVSAATGFDWKFYWTGLTSLPPQPVPPELDYDFWLGPAPCKPYHPHRVHGTFRGYWDYDGGGLGDMGMHYLDPVQYILGKDDTSPVEVWADGPQQHPDACGTWRRIEMRYADGCTIVLDGENRDKDAPFLEGPQGKIFRGFRSDIPRFEDEGRRAAGPRAADHRLRGVRADAAAVRAQRAERPPLLHARQPGQDRRPARPAAPLRPGDGALRGRRGGQPPRGPAHARPVAAAGVMPRGAPADERRGTSRPASSLRRRFGSPRSRSVARRPRRRRRRLPPPDLRGASRRSSSGFPADTPAKRDALCAEILGLGPAAVADSAPGSSRRARATTPGPGSP